MKSDLLSFFITFFIITDVIGLPRLSHNDVEEELSSETNWRLERGELTEQDFYAEHKAGNPEHITADWSTFLSKWKEGTVCKKRCKLPPQENCILVDPNDKSISRAKGHDADCCPLFKCFVHHNKFYPFHGIKGRGKTKHVHETQMKSVEPSIQRKQADLNSRVPSEEKVTESATTPSPVEEITSTIRAFVKHAGRSMGKRQNPVTSASTETPVEFSRTEIPATTEVLTIKPEIETKKVDRETAIPSTAKPILTTEMIQETTEIQATTARNPKEAIKITELVGLAAVNAKKEATEDLNIAVGKGRSFSVGKGSSSTTLKPQTKPQKSNVTPPPPPPTRKPSKRPSRKKGRGFFASLGFSILQALF